MKLGQFATLLPEVRHDGQITTVCLSTKTNERYIVCGSTDGNLSVFDRRLNHRQSILVGHDDQVCVSLLLWTFRSSYFVTSTDWVANAFRRARHAPKLVLFQKKSSE